VEYTDKQIEQLIEGIFSGAITEYNLPKSLYFAISDYLEKALTKGAMELGIEFGGKPLELIAELRENIYMFSGAKTYQQVKEMTSLLVNDEGIRGFNDFKREALKVYEQYNVNWLNTEYNTAIGQAQSALRWQQIEEQADVLPMLKYSAIIDANTSDICKPLDGITLPVGDPFWNVHSPLNHFNCFKVGTKVLTPKGWIDIQKLNVGCIVIGGDGKEHDIDVIHVNGFVGEMVNITVKNNSISSTKNHRFLTLHGWKRAENIVAYDIIIQNIEVGFFNKVICAVNNIYALLLYMLVPVIRKWKSRTIDALNSNFVFRQINIYKTLTYQFVSDTFKSFRNKKIKDSLLAICKFLMKLPHSLWLSIVGFSRFFVGAFLDFLIIHRIVKFHSLAGIGSGNPQTRVGVYFTGFGKFFRSLSAPFRSVNPLRFYGFAPFSWLKSKFAKQPHKRSIIDVPFVANESETFEVGKINDAEGFVSGAPLDSFNSLFDFVAHSFFHRKFVLVKDVCSEFYEGQIYNLSVNIANSYITNVGVVHNCRCVLIQTDGKPTPKVLVDEARKEMDSLMQPVFKMNPGKDKVIFNEKHPYFDVAPKDKAYARRNFDLPIPEPKKD